MKTTRYSLDLYHFGDDDVKAAHAAIVKAMCELLPRANITAEPCKSDFWHLVIEVTEE